MLIKLHEATVATVADGVEIISPVFDFGSYLRRYDCVVNHIDSGSLYKIYRDGTIIRACGHQGSLNGILSYDADVDLLFFHDISAAIGGNRYHDPMSMKFDPSKPSAFTNTSVSFANSVVWRGSCYHAGGVADVTRYNMAGVSQEVITVTGSITPFVVDRVFITQDGTLVLIDCDNGTYGVVRFYNLLTRTVLHTSVIESAAMAWVDTVNNNIWSIRLSDSMMQVWDFKVAPDSFSAISMGANRCRYRQDALSVTLRGAQSEPVPYWPVQWSLDTDEGHLQSDVTETDASGVARNVYCGPGADDYVGATQIITVETAY